MKYTLMLIAAIVLTALGFGVGCTKQASSGNNSASSASSLNPGQQFQAPNISGNLAPMGGGTSLLSISSLTGANSPSNGVLAPATLTLDLTATVDPAGGTLSSVVTIAGGAGVATQVAPMKWNLSFANPVLGTVSIVVKDSAGLSSSLSFVIPVQCSAASMAPIVFPANAISVTAGAGGAGYVNISVTPPSGGSGKGFTYAIDINGDGRMDYYTPNSSGATPIYLNPNPSWQNVYDLYAGSQNITVVAMDNQCQISKTYQQVVNYQSVMPAIQSGALASTSTPYYYIQGKVGPLSSGDTDPADNVNVFDAMDPGQNQDNSGIHVRCGYSWSASGGGVLSLSGFNTYNDGNTNSTTEASLQQSMSISMNIPNDNNASVLSISQLNSPATVNYQTSAAPDGNYIGSIYSGSCTASAYIVKATSEGTCGSSSGMMSGVVTMSGTYSCPSLSAGNKSVSVQNGYFYCQYNTADNCVGGGQEGGNPPPPH